ncbi:unnamed protein product [Orchesella dallaii]|uniref:Eukaryotic translation initiation factor 4E n=1 Tax=Orchesella dallaii TaxID=48710 RepID=A0ABP1QMI2_9HEXA
MASSSSANTATKGINDARVNVYSRDEERPLESTWRLWIGSSAGGLTTAEYESRLDTLGSVKSPASFWSLLEVITPPTDMDEANVYHFMKGDAKPMCTDAALTDGGTYAFSVRRRDTDDIFKQLLIACIAGNLNSVMNGNDEILGVSITVKRCSGYVSLWNKSSEAANLEELLKFLKMIMPDLKYSEESYRPNASA